MVAELFHTIAIISKSQLVRKDIFIVQKRGYYFMTTLIDAHIALSEASFNRLYHLCVTNTISPSFVGEPATHFHFQL